MDLYLRELIKNFLKKKFPRLFVILKKKSSKRKRQFFSGRMNILKSLFLNNIKKEIRRVSNKKNLVFMIILPNMLHIADIAIKCVPKNMNLVLIMTGVKRWEFKFARKKYNAFKIISSSYIFSHGVMIDILIDNLIYPFTLMDHDCFVFNKEYFNAINSCKKNEGILGFYSYYNYLLNINIPHTFFLILNPVFLQNIKKRCNVTSLCFDWWNLPSNVKNKFKRLGMGEKYFIEPFKKYFDTLRVLSLLCYIKKGLRFITKYDLYDYKDIFHIGGAAHGGKENICLNGKYISCKILETIADPYLIKKYKKYKKYLGNSEEILSKIMLNKKNKFTENFIKFSKELFKKLNIE